VVLGRVHRHSDRRHPSQGEPGLSGSRLALAGPIALTAGAELHPALLQATITLGLAGLCVLLYRRYNKRYLLWWAVAWSLYLLRLVAIIAFLTTGRQVWLFAHQVFTGWTALALLWSALVFSRDTPFSPAYLALIPIPLVWSLFAVNAGSSPLRFYLAAIPAVLFLSLANLWTARVFLRFRHQTRSRGALILGVAFLFWGLHHLDYPLLRARGGWNPWGYYLDIIFALSVGLGIMLLVLEDVDRGLTALAALSGDLQRGEAVGDGLAALLARPLALPGVRGTAMYLRETGRYVRGAGIAGAWAGRAPSADAMPTIRAAVEGRHPVSVRDWHESVSSERAFAFAAVLPIFRRQEVNAALIIVGDARDPFTALDESFLLALGQQVGAALENSELYQSLRRRTDELERLGSNTIRAHEDERRRLSLELHDETAQVFSAVKLQLGMLREKVSTAQTERVDRIMSLVDAGMRSIRNVTEELRPSLLGDLGLVPALRALIRDFGHRASIETSFTGPDHVDGLDEDAELALFRAVQEGLSNVARHADARRVDVTLDQEEGVLRIDLVDDGRGPATMAAADGRMGLAGMRERLSAFGGHAELAAAARGGARLTIRLPTPGRV
jgi:signal transduction histidine kinase